MGEGWGTSRMISALYSVGIYSVNISVFLLQYQGNTKTNLSEANAVFTKLCL